MNLSTDTFHDAIILTVTEHPITQTIDYLIDYPTDWANHIFEHRLLRFSEVTYYLIKELPFEGSPTILDMEYKSIKVVDTFGNPVTTLIIHTNAGFRQIEYKAVELIKVY